MYTSKVTTPQDAHGGLVLQVYLGLNTLEFNAMLLLSLINLSTPSSSPPLLPQVVCNNQLALHCRGNAASFSARVVAIDTSGKSKASCPLTFHIAPPSCQECMVMSIFQ